MAVEKPLQATELNEGVEKSDETVDLGEKYEIPEPEPFISFNALKDRIRHHYELASDYYYSLWYVLKLTTSLLLH
jgi:tocopherol O-methyltransferase